MEHTYVCIYIYSSLEIILIYIFFLTSICCSFHTNHLKKKKGADGCSKQTVHNMSGDVLCYLLRVDYN